MVKGRGRAETAEGEGRRPEGTGAGFERTVGVRLEMEFGESGFN